MKTLAIALLLCFGATALGAENRSIKVTAKSEMFEARKLAVTYAREKAEHLTQLTETKLGSPIRIEEEVEENWNAGGFGGIGGGFTRSDRPKPDLEPVARDKGPWTFVAFQQAVEKKGDALIAAGQIIITAHVTIEYEISK